MSAPPSTAPVGPARSGPGGAKCPTPHAAAFGSARRIGNGRSRRPFLTFPGSPGWEETVVLPEFQRILVGQTTVEAAADAILTGLESTLN